MPSRIWQPFFRSMCGLGVLDVALHADLDAAEAVDDAGEPAEPDLDVAVDRQAGGLLERGGEQLRAADGERRVDLVVALARDRQVAVARDRDEHRLPGAARGVHEDDRVGAPALGVAADTERLALRRGQALAAVRAHEQVGAAVGVRRAVARRGRVLAGDLRPRVHGGERRRTRARRAAGPATTLTPAAARPRAAGLPAGRGAAAAARATGSTGSTGARPVDRARRMPCPGRPRDPPVPPGVPVAGPPSRRRCRPHPPRRPPRARRARATGAAGAARVDDVDVVVVAAGAGRPTLRDRPGVVVVAHLVRALWGPWCGPQCAKSGWDHRRHRSAGPRRASATQPVPPRILVAPWDLSEDPRCSSARSSRRRSGSTPGRRATPGATGDGPSRSCCSPSSCPAAPSSPPGTGGSGGSRCGCWRACSARRCSSASSPW